MKTAHREARQKLQQSQRRQNRDYDMRLYVIPFIDLTGLLCWDKVKKIQPIWSGPWIVTQVILSVLYRIANCKRSMVAHHDALKLCSDRDLPIWLLRKRHELTGEDVGNRVLEQATDALRDPDEYGDGDNLGLEDLFAEMIEEGLEQRPQTQEMDSGDEASPDVLNDDYHEFFKDYIEIDDNQREATRGIPIFYLSLTELFA